MIKKTTLVPALLATALALSTNVNAATKSTDTKLYSSKSHPAMLRTAQGFYETDIWIHNQSDFPFWVDTPSMGNYDLLYPGDNDELYSDAPYDYVHVIMKDIDGYVFFDDLIPNDYDVTVDDDWFFAQKNTSSKKAKPRVTLKRHVG